MTDWIVPPPAGPASLNEWARWCLAETARQDARRPVFLDVLTAKGSSVSPPIRGTDEEG